MNALRLKIFLEELEEKGIDLADLKVKSMWANIPSSVKHVHVLKYKQDNSKPFIVFCPCGQHLPKPESIDTLAGASGDASHKDTDNGS